MHIIQPLCRYWTLRTGTLHRSSVLDVLSHIGLHNLGKLIKLKFSKPQIKISFTYLCLSKRSTENRSRAIICTSCTGWMCFIIWAQTHGFQQIHWAQDMMFLMSRMVHMVLELGATDLIFPRIVDPGFHLCIETNMRGKMSRTQSQSNTVQWLMNICSIMSDKSWSSRFSLKSSDRRNRHKIKVSSQTTDPRLDKHYRSPHYDELLKPPHCHCLDI